MLLRYAGKLVERTIDAPSLIKWSLSETANKLKFSLEMFDSVIHVYVNEFVLHLCAQYQCLYYDYY